MHIASHACTAECPHRSALSALERRNTELEKELAHLRAQVENVDTQPIPYDLDGLRIGIAEALGLRIQR